MSNRVIKIGELDSEISNILKEYSKDTTDKIKKITKEETELLVKNTKRDSPKRTGNYSKHITYKIDHESANRLVCLWYVKNPYHWLTHLLEDGHVIKSTGKRTKAYKFISKNEKETTERLEKRTEEAIKNGY